MAQPGNTESLGIGMPSLEVSALPVTTTEDEAITESLATGMIS
jgi:hypothetical protein